MHAKTMTVTPEMAARWLEHHNSKNRRVSQHHVGNIADQIRKGLWVLNGQSISFDDNGRLLDGQHRLHAVALCGISTPMLVVTGVTDPEAFKTYDGHVLKRGAHQVGEMMGLLNANSCVAAARIVMTYERSRTIQEFSMQMRRNKTDSPAEVAEFALSIESEFQRAKSLVPHSLLTTSHWKAGMTAFAILFGRVDREATDAFFDTFRTGSYKGEHCPCLQLTHRLMSGRKGVSNHEWQRQVAAFTIKAFNAFRKGNSMKNLRWRTNGGIPEKFPGIDGGLQ